MLDNNEIILIWISFICKLLPILLCVDRQQHFEIFGMSVGSPPKLIGLAGTQRKYKALKGSELLNLRYILNLFLDPSTQRLAQNIMILFVLFYQLFIVNSSRVIDYPHRSQLLAFNHQQQSQSHEVAIQTAHYQIDIKHYILLNHHSYKSSFFPFIQPNSFLIQVFLSSTHNLQLNQTISVLLYQISVSMSCGKLLNPHFIGVICFITFNYFVYTYEYMITLQPNHQLLLLIIFHILFALLLCSMIRAIVGDPGRVPIYWGFFAEESENRKRRYCLLCHSFKPERCHHCSTCQRCVLNMDHHCPWIANCVGFTNRKFFMLFLFYVILTLIYCLGCEIPILVGQIIDLVKGNQKLSIALIIRTIGTLVQASFFIVISIFFKFHVELVLSNSTTLDNLERQRNPNAGPNVYDIGSYDNFQQVFGTNWLLWLIPISPTSSNKANGVVWPKNQPS